jgi:cytoskeletal protein CcmA (bactofilin family)
MFSKPDKPNPPRAELAEANRKAIAASLISPNVTITGDLISDGDVQLDGAVVGDVRVGRLTIGESGSVEGAVHAEAVDVRGRVAGSISAATVRLHATARVDGDITHAQLSIEAGAHFQGRSLLAEPAAPALSVAAE